MEKDHMFLLFWLVPLSLSYERKHKAKLWGWKNSPFRRELMPFRGNSITGEAVQVLLSLVENNSTESFYTYAIYERRVPTHMLLFLRQCGMPTAVYIVTSHQPAFYFLRTLKTWIWNVMPISTFPPSLDWLISAHHIKWKSKSEHVSHCRDNFYCHA